MIAQRIFDGEDAQSIGITEHAYQSRKETLQRYLDQSGGVFDEQGYIEWLQTNEQRSDPDAGASSKQLPSFAKQAVSLAKAATKHVSSGAKKVPAEEAKRRMDICESCDMWVEQGTVKFFGKEIEVKRRCSACGCAMDVKATWATSHCIQGKW